MKEKKYKNIKKQMKRNENENENRNVGESNKKKQAVSSRTKYLISQPIMTVIK